MLRHLTRFLFILALAFFASGETSALPRIRAPQNELAGQKLAPRIFSEITSILRHLAASQAAELQQEKSSAVENIVSASPLAAESGIAKGGTETVFHTVKSPGAGQGVLNGIDTQFLNAESRFGKAFYISDDAATTVAEMAHHNTPVTNTIRYEMDLTKAKVLDLTDPAVAKAWGYTGGDISAATKAIGEQAQQAGYNTIKFQSLRGPGTNCAVLTDFEQVLKPQMIVPTPPTPPSTTLPAPDLKK